MSIFSAAVVNLEGIDDIQDFSRETDEESSMSSEIHNHLYDLMQIGNRAFRENRLDQAIEFYSEANNVKPGNSIILSNRCAAYIRIIHFLKHRPPSDSENNPLSGLDPTTLAGKLEKYDLAQDFICSGLQIDPQSFSLMNLKRSVDNIFMRRSQVRSQRTDDYDCTLCLKLLYEPTTTPCGHSFCRSCLFQTMDRGNRCPLCRRVLFYSPGSCSISVTLNNIIQKNFPEEYAERKMENDSLTNPGADLLPLFVMDVILPCQKFHLNIFEPRYRLMVRRIMEGNHRMGMTVIDSTTGSVADYACEVEIIDYEPLPDGRFFIEVESRRRCRIIRNWDQDGYRIAEIEWVEDTYPSEGTERDDLLEMTQRAAEFASQWIKGAQEAVQGDEVKLAKLFKAQGLMPSTRNPECFSFWLATLTNRRPSDKLDLLRMRDTKERIRRSLLYMKGDCYFRR
ncbi:hypothetical protein CASFOL_018401 [Castilleja foliolosa]|uniref:LON peptidase N-terminal domain and RING finger protein 1 n=1 Tax=Castilleja foliolosa TaxID=1961234 RepID=A0ABD3D7A2_9LAMI